MIRDLLWLSVVSLSAALAQFSRADTRGEVTSNSPVAFQTLKIEMSAAQAGGPLSAHVEPSGRFEFRGIPEGHYQLTILTQHGERLQQESVHVTNSGAPLTVRLQQHAVARPYSGFVSLRRLSHRPQKAALKALAAAQRAYEKNDLDEMRDQLAGASEADPEFFEPLILLARDHLRRGENKEALVRLDQALAIDASSADGHALRAYGLLKTRQLGGAVAEAKRALLFDSEQKIALQVLAAAAAFTSKSSKPTASGAASSLAP
jgi:tetratricopeptide (TPR) repeat protein